MSKFFIFNDHLAVIWQKKKAGARYFKEMYSQRKNWERVRIRRRLDRQKRELSMHRRRPLKRFFVQQELGDLERPWNAYQSTIRQEW